MRKAFQDVKIINDGDNFWGISLGYDFCAEHEWGIDEMKRKFGIDSTKMGVDGRQIQKSEVILKEEKKLCVLTSYVPYETNDYSAKDLIPHDIYRVGETIDTAWDSRNFCIVTKNPEYFKYLRELYDNFKKNNIIITFLQSKIELFDKTALSILIKDKLPEEALNEMMHVDKKHRGLFEYEEKIGVKKLKEEAKKNSTYQGDKYFMACSPKWIDYENEENREKIKKQLGTKYDIRFWVNYSDDDNNYGWYTAEDIIKWLSTPGLKLKSLNK